jgi:hypothetical protein
MRVIGIEWCKVFTNSSKYICSQLDRSKRWWTKENFPFDYLLITLRTAPSSSAYVFALTLIHFPNLITKQNTCESSRIRTFFDNCNSPTRCKARLVELQSLFRLSSHSDVWLDSSPRVSFHVCSGCSEGVRCLLHGLLKAASDGWRECCQERNRMEPGTLAEHQTIGHAIFGVQV